MRGAQRENEGASSKKPQIMLCPEQTCYSTQGDPQVGIAGYSTQGRSRLIQCFLWEIQPEGQPKAAARGMLLSAHFPFMTPESLDKLCINVHPGLRSAVGN